MADPSHTEIFYAGRGPELQRVCWGRRGAQLQAIEYFNADDIYDDASLKHVRFEGCQVVQITPEEVVQYEDLGPRLARSRSAAMFDLGKSDWLKSFSQYHLAACTHFRLLFY